MHSRAHAHTHVHVVPVLGVYECIHAGTRARMSLHGSGGSVRPHSDRVENAYNRHDVKGMRMVIMFAGHDLTERAHGD